MAVEVEFGDEEIADEPAQEQPKDLDEYLAQNSFRIVYQTNNFFLPQFRDMIDNEETINLRPEYQRRLRWTNAQKSKLIESLLLNIPVPPVFFYEADAARYEVMDGQQRLTTIRDFFANEFALTGLKVLSPLNRLRYAKCSPRVKRSLDRATISAIILLMESKAERPAEGKFSTTDIRRLVFSRLNTGGRQLSAQEIRNALNPGPLNECIIQLSRFAPFTDVFGIPPYTTDDEGNFYDDPKRQKNNLYSSMRDCELVLRFVALRDPDNIRGSIKSILDRAMEAKMTKEQADELAEAFRSRFQFLCDLFGGSPFKIISKTDGREKVAAALYDASMVALDRVWTERERIRADKAAVIARVSAAIAGDESYDLIVGRHNTADSIKERIKLLQRAFLPE